MLLEIEFLLQVARDRAVKLVSEMNQTEKFLMMSGSYGTYTGNVVAIDRLGSPSLGLQDGPQGFRVSTDKVGSVGSTTAWPSVLSVAASWDMDLISRWGMAMGEEFKGKVIHLFNILLSRYIFLRSMLFGLHIICSV